MPRSRRPRSQRPHDAPSAWDLAIEGLLLALLTWLPLAFGGVFPVTHAMTMVVAAAVALLIAGRTLTGGRPLRFSRSFFPVFLFVGFVAVQGVELPLGLLETIAPSTADTWRTLLTEPAGPGSAALEDGASLSLNPRGTDRDLRLLLAGAVLFVAAVDVFRRDAARRLLWWMSLLGGGVALVTIAQVVTGASAIYWSWEVPGKLARAGTFVHYGHLSQFLNLSIGCAVALILIRAVERQTKEELELEELFSRLSHYERRPDLYLALGIVLCMAAIAVSTSRNGTISTLVGATVVAFWLQRTQFLVGVGWPMLGLLFTAFVAVVVIGFDPVYERLSTLETPGSAYSGRLALLVDTLSAFAEFPVFGMGQGTFEWTFPMFDQDTRNATAAHAENQYAELLSETGIVGTALIVTFAVMVIRRATRRGRSIDKPLHAAVYGIGFGLTAVAFHATTDFGLRIPAIAVTTLVLAGLVVSMASDTRKAESRTARVGFATALVVAALGLLAQLPAALRAREADNLWDTVRAGQVIVRPPEFVGTVEQFDEILEAANAAVALAPDDVEYRYWTQVYRWMRLKAEYSELSREERVAQAPRTQALAREVRDELLAARAVGPTFGPLWSMVGQLGLIWLEDRQAGRWIERGRKFAPHYAGTAYAYALLLALEGKQEDCVREFERALKLGFSWRWVLEALLNEYGSLDIALALVQGSAERTEALAGWLRGIGGQDELADELSATAMQLILEQLEEPGAPLWMWDRAGDHFAKQGDDAKAIEHWARYLARAPRSGVRFKMALAYERTGDFAAAMREMRLIKTHVPANDALYKRADQWLERLGR